MSDRLDLKDTDVKKKTKAQKKQKARDAHRALTWLDTTSHGLILYTSSIK